MLKLLFLSPTDEVCLKMLNEVFESFYYYYTLSTTSLMQRASLGVDREVDPQSVWCAGRVGHERFCERGPVSIHTVSLRSDVLLWRVRCSLRLTFVEVCVIEYRLSSLNFPIR